MQDVELSCACGKVRGSVRGAAPRAVNHVFCYCDDCQAYLHHLDRADLMDAHGGSEIIQVGPSSVTFDRGADELKGVRLGPKGLFRWYASCCRTPLGNTLTPSIPFVGVSHAAFGGLDASRRAEVFGPPWPMMGKFAVGEPPEGSTKIHVRGLAQAARLMLGWKLRGKAWPHPFFDRATGAPRYPVTVLTRAEREALRPLCGPKPA